VGGGERCSSRGMPSTGVACPVMANISRGAIPAAKQNEVDAGSEEFPGCDPGILGRRLTGCRMYDLNHRKAGRGQGASV
jgi:hypothetical protein